MKIFSSERGMGMVEVMVAVGVMAIAMLAFISQSANQVGSQKNIRSTAELHSTVEEIQQAFAANGVCKSNLQNLAFDKTQLNPANTYPDLPVPQIALPSAPSSPLVVNGAALKNLPGSSVQVTLIEVKELAADSLYSGKLRFNLSKDATSPSHTSVVGPNTIYRDLPVTLKVSVSGSTETVQDCFTGMQSTTSSSTVDGSDVGNWVGSGASTDPGVPDCTAGLAFAVRNSGTPLSVSGKCIPLAAKCKIPAYYPGQFFLETCTGTYTDASGSGGGGGTEGGPI